MGQSAGLGPAEVILPEAAVCQALLFHIRAGRRRAGQEGDERLGILASANRQQAAVHSRHGVTVRHNMVYAQQQRGFAGQGVDDRVEQRAVVQVKAVARLLIEYGGKLLLAGKWDHAAGERRVARVVL